MNPNILIALISSTIWIVMVRSHSIPLMQMIQNPSHLQQSNYYQQLPIQLQQHLNQLASTSSSMTSRRQARGLLSTLAGLGSVAATTNLLVGKDPDDDDGLTGSGASSNSNSNKPKPYAFNDVEMTAIQAMISLRNLLGDLLHKVGVNIPASLQSFITRSENGNEKNMLSGPNSFLANAAGGDSTAASLLSSATSKANAMLILRGLALSLPLLIPMANQLRRMSSDNGVVDIPSATSHLSSTVSQSAAPFLQQLPQLPQFDPYGYDRALHRRRGKRSIQSSATSSSVPQSSSTQPILISEPINRLLRHEEQQRIIRFLKDWETTMLYGSGGSSNGGYNNGQNTNQLRRRILFSAAAPRRST